ncbi:MAG: hypothetical protein WBC92_02595 [Terracidiphilus sp.]
MTGSVRTEIESELWAYWVQCENRHCEELIPLPRESPLGRLEGQTCQLTGEWPAEFLCPKCGRVFSCSNPHQGFLPILFAWESSLLRVPYQCGPNKSAAHKIMFTGSSSLFPQHAALQKVQEYAQGVWGGDASQPECFPW